ncbi:MAG: hypothetical protein LUD72_02615 [Bacteroidales bacterium]|nr:hypothetical protein [Bacteroidales bacterium]
MNEVHITPACIASAIRESVAHEIRRQEKGKRAKALRITESVMKTIKNAKQNLTESKNGEKIVNLTATDLRNLVKKAVLQERMEKSEEGTTLETFDYSQIPSDIYIEADDVVRQLDEEGDGYQSLPCHVDYYLDDGLVEVSCVVWGWVEKDYDPEDYYTAPCWDVEIECSEITDLEIKISDEDGEDWPEEKVNEKIKDLDFSDLYSMEGKYF